jgi:hypothetical protein
MTDRTEKPHPKRPAKAMLSLMINLGQPSNNPGSVITAAHSTALHSAAPGVISHRVAVRQAASQVPRIDLIIPSCPDCSPVVRGRAGGGGRATDQGGRDRDEQHGGQDRLAAVQLGAEPAQRRVMVVTWGLLVPAVGRIGTRR